MELDKGSIMTPRRPTTAESWLGANCSINSYFQMDRRNLSMMMIEGQKPLVPAAVQ